MGKGPWQGWLVTCELYGVVRLRAKEAECVVEASTVREALQELVRRHPSLTPDLLSAEGQPVACLVILNGLYALGSGDRPVRPGDRLLITTPDVGG
jgi:molybdopterin converting factor small subunit